MRKIFITGGAGLLGFNLCKVLLEKDDVQLTVLDKNSANLKKLQIFFPSVDVIRADLSVMDGWEKGITNYDHLIICHAQITSLDKVDFEQNNILATKNLLKIFEDKNLDSCIHISSSVVNSKAEDFYSKTKRDQEKLVISSKLPYTILRPTLMFGLFDRKHLGWLSKFMSKSPIFPIPGKGNYLRQPLYVKDFCKIIEECLNGKHLGKVYNISGQTKIFYIDIIRSIKKVTNSKSVIMKIPYSLFFILLKIYSFFVTNPPFNVNQLRALVIPETFEIIDWENIFAIKQTDFKEALDETFNDPSLSNIELDRL